MVIYDNKQKDVIITNIRHTQDGLEFKGDIFYFGFRLRYF